MGMLGRQPRPHICPRCGKEYAYERRFKSHVAKCQGKGKKQAQGQGWGAGAVPPGAVPTPGTPGQVSPPPAPGPQQPPNQGPGQFQFGNFQTTTEPNKSYPIPQGAGSGAPGQMAPAPPPGMAPQQYGYYPYPYQQPVQTFTFSPGVSLCERGGDILNHVFETNDFDLSARQKMELKECMAAMQFQTTNPGEAIGWILAMAWGPAMFMHLDDNLEFISKFKTWLKSKRAKNDKDDPAPDPAAPAPDPTTKKLFGKQARRDERRKHIVKPGDQQTIIKSMDQWSNHRGETVVKAACRQCQEITSVMYDEAPKLLRYGCVGCAPVAWGVA